MRNEERYKKLIEDYINDYFKNKNGYNKVIYESMNYSLTVGGKRIRPILMVMTYRLYKENLDRILPLALAIEMIHTYSLIHDDLPAMDNDDLRRGKPTNHKIYGEAIAILAGDGLLNEAMNIMLNTSIKEGKEALKASEVISNSSGCEGMIGGQVVDILSEDKKISLDELLYMHNNKTGALITASVLAGGIMGGASQSDINKLKVFGEKLGLAFQIKDDILDIEGNANVLGKSQSDAENNKSNFIKFYGIDRCKEYNRELTEQCIDILQNLNKDTEDLKDLTLELLNRNF